MTYIASVITKNGILMVSDNLELQTGAISRYDDFNNLIKEKGATEDSDQPLLSPKEVYSTYKGERIKNIDGAQKTFKLDSHAAFQLSGSVEILGQELSKSIGTQFTPELLSTFQNPIQLNRRYTTIL